MKQKLFSIFILVAIALPAKAISDYNWYDYQILTPPAQEYPLILPLTPGNPYALGSEWAQGQPAPPAIQIQHQQYDFGATEQKGGWAEDKSNVNFN